MLRGRGLDSSMTNYLFTVNCAVNVAHREHGLEAPSAPGVREAYDQMWQLQQQSAHKYLQGSWTTVVITDPAESRNHMFQRTYQAIRDLWHAEPCNILFMDSDCVFQKPTEIFGEFTDFRLFNRTTAPPHARFLDYYNCAVRYYPAQMKPTTWSIGDLWLREWNYSIYDHEQEMYNGMFWHQHPDNPHRPELNYQAPECRTREQAQAWSTWNGCSFDSAHIVHYHGTRGAQTAVTFAQDLCN